MTLGSRTFVFFVCAILGITFFVSSGVLIWEFWEKQLWLDFALKDSHLFLFFSSFAVLALIAFYLPACAVVDVYWHHLAFGKLRLIVGFLVLMVVAWVLASFILHTPNKSIWNISYAVLESDRGLPRDCIRNGGDCERVPILQAVENLRTVSQNRGSLRPLVRRCSYDPLIEPDTQMGPRRYCMVTTAYSSNPALKSDPECCQAQRRFVAHVNRLQKPNPRWDMEHLPNVVRPIVEVVNSKGQSSQSVTGAIHALLLPFKSFFLIALIAVSALLTIHLRKIEQFYGRWLLRIETGIITGTFALLLFPLMSQAFLESQDALVGDIGQGNFSVMVPILSFSFGVWTLLNLLYFYRRADKQVEILAKIGGTAAGIVALIQYQAIVDFLVRLLGSGASWMLVVVLFAVAFMVGFGLLGFFFQPARQDAGPGSENRQPG